MAKKRALDGSEYFPGFVGLNNLKKTDYLNVMLHALSKVEPLRDFCLHNQSSKKRLLGSFADLVKKMWNN